MKSLTLATVLGAVATASCGGPAGPSEYGMAVPKDPGTVIVYVRDQAGAPVPGTLTCVEMPNDVGSVFKYCGGTAADGKVILDSVSSGRRKVDVTPPSGYSAGPGGLVQEVDVLKNLDSLIEFQLTRN